MTRRDCFLHKMKCFISVQGKLYIVLENNTLSLFLTNLMSLVDYKQLSLFATNLSRLQ